MNKEYQRGYQARNRSIYNPHKPPIPPNHVISPVFLAANKLRDAADTICASLMEDDEFVKELSPKIDDFDKAMKDFNNWLGDENDLIP